MFEFEIHSNVKYQIDRANGEVAVLEYMDTPLSSHVTIRDNVHGLPVKEICSEAFSLKSNLQSIKLPDSISTIDKKAFSDCDNLNVVQFYKSRSPSKSVYFGQYAFAKCFNLTKVDFAEPKNINCGLHAFENCISLNGVYGFLECIDESVFLNCKNLESIKFANDAYWKPNTFTGCSKLTHITFLGNICFITSETAIKKVISKHIKCKPSSNVVELSYRGAKIELF